MSQPSLTPNDSSPGSFEVDTPRRKWWKIAVPAIVLVLAAVLGVGALYVSNLQSSFEEKRTVLPEAFPTSRPTPSLAADYNGYTFLLIGSDSPISIDSNEGGDQRSDSMMLVNIPTDRSKVYVTSILRDTYVPIPGHGEAKINSAMSKGGIPLLVETLESLTGARIDHVTSVDFTGFEKLTTALGGVEVENPTEFTAHDGDYYPAGTLDLEGEYALNYVRERKAFIDSDYQRVRNQQDFLKAVFSKVTSAGTLANPVKLQDLIQDFSPYLTTDRDLTAEALARIAISLKDLDSEDIVSFTINNYGPAEVPETGESIVEADLEAFTDYGIAINTDTMEDYKSFALGEKAAAQAETETAETPDPAVDPLTGAPLEQAPAAPAAPEYTLEQLPVTPVDPAAPVDPYTGYSYTG